MKDLEFFNNIGKDKFPGYMGIVVTSIDEQSISMEMPIRPELFAPNGFVHGGSIVSLADTAAGYATILNLPEGAKSFTTIELKTNFVGAAREGTLECECMLDHKGRTTQVWRIIVRHKEKQKNVAIFTCTNLILY